MLVCHLLEEKRCKIVRLPPIIENGVLPSTTATMRGAWTGKTVPKTPTIRTTDTPSTVQDRSQN